MFVWAAIPEPFTAMGSLEFAKMLMREAQVAVSPGIGFGPMGEGFVRFSLIEKIIARRKPCHASGACSRVVPAASPAPIAPLSTPDIHRAARFARIIQRT